MDTTPFVVRETHLETSGELPGDVIDLVDNKAYLPRHRKLQREHGDKVLLKLAELAKTKGKPSRWYATVTSVANWGRTLAMVKELLATTRRAVEVMAKLDADPTWLRWYVKTVATHSEARIAQWVERAQRGRRPARLFAHLAGGVS
ncbi:hypothetical protein [Rhodococcus aetherivorans]|uniref:hypothetical protein n=1 Tax=Rhodococcus aetherivorans TaxID=191292 RepID=UPI001260FD36|nr:hypothetical protein [Rhodococcus aetherivorans]MDV6295213.1 hypothetical protein [Rhodococcus aetherivorans]NGP28033.1 hypothetical protein [Rhodococcus aetherivorans]